MVVADDRGGVGGQTYNLLVQDEVPNAPPVITSVPAVVSTAEVLYEYQVEANDPDGTTLQYSLATNPTGMAIDVNTGLVNWTPSNAQAGQLHNVEVLATDAHGAIGSQAYTVAVNISKQRPVLNNRPETLTLVGDEYAWDVNVTDADNDPLTYELTTAPAGMTIDQLGRIRWTPEASDVGVARVELLLVDDRGLGVTFGCDLDVVQDDQVALSLSSNPAPLGEPVTITVQAVDDIAVASLLLEVDGVPLALDGNGMATQTFDAVAQINLVATATDATGNTGEANLVLSVIDPSDVAGPFVEIASPVDGQMIEALTDVIGTVTDDNLLFYTLEVAPVRGGEFREIARGSTAVTNDVLGAFDATALRNNSYVLRLTAQDAGGNISTARRVVNVTGDLKIGHLSLAFRDLVINTSGIPLTVTRTYNSLDASVQGDYGFGWRMEFREVDIETGLPSSGFEDSGLYTAFREGTRVYVTLPGGRREGFTFAPSRQNLFFDLDIYHPRFVPDPTNASRLSVKDTTLKLVDGEFRSLGGGLPYNPASEDFGGTYTLTTLDAITWTIDPNEGVATKVVDRRGNSLTLSDSGIVSSDGRDVDFERDTQGRILTMTDPAGNVTRYRYDARGDLVAVTDPEQNTVRIIYDDRHLLQDVIDPEGRVIRRTEYGDDGRVISQTDGEGNTIRYERDLTARTETQFDAAGNPRTMVYDENGLVTSIINALGNTATYSYDGSGNVRTQTDPLGNTTTFAYNALGRPTSVTSPRGHTFLTTFGSFGEITSSTDPLGNIYITEYDSHENVIEATDSLGHKTTMQYDGRGNLLSLTDALGTTTAHTYNSFGDLTSQTDATGNVTNLEYDDNGNLTQESTTRTLADGSQDLVATVREYDALNRLRKTTGPEGNASEFTYNSVGAIPAVNGSGGLQLQFEVNGRGEGTRGVFSHGSAHEFAYDARGNLSEQTDRGGNVTSYEYDELNRQTSKTTPTGANVQYTYNAGNLVESIVDANGNEHRFSQDADARLTRRELPDGTAMEYTYDEAGRLVSVADTRGNTVSSTWDERSRGTSQTFADGSSVRAEYDALGRVVARIDQLDRRLEAGYDGLGRLTSVTDLAGGVTRYEYDEIGNLIAFTDALQRTTRLEHDKVGRLIRRTLPLGMSESFTYNARGFLESHTSFNSETTTYGYNDLGQRTSVEYPDGSTEVTTYSPHGKVASIVDAAGTMEVTYDDFGRITEVSDPHGETIAYAYNSFGNLLTLTTSMGTTTYTYDTLNRVETVTDPDDNVTSYGYDDEFSLIETTYPNGVVTAITFDDMNRMNAIENRRSEDQLLSRYVYSYDATGNIVLVEEDSGRQAEYFYDLKDQLIREFIVDPVVGNETIENTYDAVGNRLTKTDSWEPYLTPMMRTTGFFRMEQRPTRTTIMAI